MVGARMGVYFLAVATAALVGLDVAEATWRITTGAKYTAGTDAANPPMNDQFWLSTGPSYTASFRYKVCCSPCPDCPLPEMPYIIFGWTITAYGPSGQLLGSGGYTPPDESGECLCCAGGTAMTSASTGTFAGATKLTVTMDVGCACCAYDEETQHHVAPSEIELDKHPSGDLTGPDES